MSEMERMHDPEAGILERIRTIRDVCPWLALGDALGPASSFIALGLTLLAMGVSWLGLAAIDQLSGVDPDRPFLGSRTSSIVVLPGWIDVLQRNGPSLLTVIGGLTAPLQQVISTDTSLGGVLRGVVKQLWIWWIWLWPAGYVMRECVLAVAGRSSMATETTMRLLAHRAFCMWSAPVLILVASGLLFVLSLVVGWIALVPWMELIAGWMLFPLAILAGFLLVGLVIGVPLMWVAAVTEPQADTFDCASRAFEYLIQRPLKGASYLLLGTIVTWIIMGVGHWIIRSGLGWFAKSTTITGDDTMFSSMSTAVSLVLQAYGLNLGFALLAVVYLLLRRDANQQEMEEVWEPTLTKERSLPPLKLDEKGVPISSQSLNSDLSSRGPA